MKKPSKALLAAVDATVAGRRKAGQPCRMCSLPQDVKDAIAYGRNERGFTFVDCAQLLARLNVSIAPTTLRYHFSNGHGNP